MQKINHLNSVYMNYRTPLLKWRVMDLESLRRECDAGPNYQHFARVIRMMEKANIVEGYKHRFNGKKYIYLSPFGEGQVASEKNPTAISKDSLIHDIKVSEIARNFMNFGWIDHILLEHHLLNKRDFRAVYKVIPDALLESMRNGKKIKCAFELELTQKNKQRIKEKVKQYMISSRYDYIIYFFSKESVMNTYMSVVKDIVGEKNLDRFLFVTDKAMTAKETNLDSLYGICNDEKVLVSEFLIGENGVKEHNSDKKTCSPIR